jgi:hypothetical protein
MTTAEVSDLKWRTEAKIKEMLAGLEEQSGCKVTGIQYESLEETNLIGKPTIISQTVTIRLEIE